MSSSKPAPLPELEISFADPIEHGGKLYNNVVLREPRAGEVQRALATLGANPGPDALYKYNTVLIGAVAGTNGVDVPRQVVEKIPVRQFNQAAKYLEGFLDEPPATGGI